MPGRAAPRILVVDDDAKIVRLVRMYLEREGFDVVEASDGAAALARLRDDDVALVVLDMMLPEVDGMAVLRAVRERADTAVVVVSARGMTSDRITGLSAGADDYLPKPFSPAELVIRVKRVLARTTRQDAADPRGGALRLGDLVLDPARHLATIGGRPLELTTLEFRLLRALIAADGRVLSRDQLLDALYGTDEESVLERTIDVHVGRLRDRLGDSADAPRYIATVRGVGYRAVAGADAEEAAG